MPQAEIFPFPPRRPSADGDVPADVVSVLRVLARQAAEAGADPSAIVSPDHELLLICDTIMMLKRQSDEAFAAWKASPFSDLAEENENWKRKKRAVSLVLQRAGKLQASTPVGIFAKAAAVRRVRTDAAALAVSLADDLLASPALRAAIWPATDQ